MYYKVHSFGAVSENAFWHALDLKQTSQFCVLKWITIIIIAGLWDSFLEMRIRLQKAIVVANKLPQKDEMAEFSSLRDTNLKEVYKQGTGNYKN